MYWFSESGLLKKMQYEEEGRVFLVVDQILEKFVKKDEYDDEEYSLFNISEIKQKIIPHCRSIHALMEILYRHLADYQLNSTTMTHHLKTITNI